MFFRKIFIVLLWFQVIYQNLLLHKTNTHECIFIFVFYIYLFEILGA